MPPPHRVVVAVFPDVDLLDVTGPHPGHLTPGVHRHPPVPPYAGRAVGFALPDSPCLIHRRKARS
ncbi:hypothetical protein [Streptomyces chryseus]|uniref:hypothetical protein n=1 Tax=Streptomyces chryseus TaxID=68186 RepID=UPI00110FA1BB|nr:hypothetical protein [Streptomyces chryseus]